MTVPETLADNSHTFGEWETTAPATCTEAGDEHRVCSVCQAEETRPIEALGHDYAAEWTIDQPATCTEPGSQSHHCTRCGDKADVTAIDPTGHTFGEWETVESPGCLDKGSEKRVCAACGFTETRDVDALGHDWEDTYTVDKAATCTEDGSESIHCRNCEAVKDSRTLPALGHDWEESMVKAPTCTEPGEKLFTCLNDDSHSYTEEIPALGHDFSDEWTVDKEPTETEPGSQSHHCTRCDEPDEDTAVAIPATGPADDEVPQTGESPLALLIGAVLVTGSAALALLARKRRKANLTR